MISGIESRCYIGRLQYFLNRIIARILIWTTRLNTLRTCWCNKVHELTEVTNYIKPIIKFQAPNKHKISNISLIPIVELISQQHLLQLDSQ